LGRLAVAPEGEHSCWVSENERKGGRYV
jgi:hypothetical protein